MNTFLKFNQDKFEGLIITTIIIILIIIIGFWYQLIEKPKEKKEFDKWLEENEKTLNLKKEIKNILIQLSNQITPCIKCSNVIFQIWDINSTIVFRCCNCKRKQEHSIDSIEDIKTILDLHLFYYQEYLSVGNNKIKNYLENYLEWDFNAVRKGNSLYSAFKFEAIKKPEKEVLTDPTKNKTRRISQKVKNQVWNRDNGKCVECGSNEKLEFDHIIPFSKGGSNTYRNIQLLCENCNRTKSDKIG